MPFAGSASDYDKFIANKTEKRGRIVKSSGAKPD